MIHLIAATLPQQSTGPTIVRNCGYCAASETTAFAKVELAGLSFDYTTPYRHNLFEGSGTQEGSSELANPFWTFW